MKIKNHLPLIFGISIPLLMIVFVALSIYIPQLFVKPQYSFLYLNGNNYCYAIPGTDKKIYYVQDNRLVMKDTQTQPVSSCQSEKRPIIFIYDVVANQSKEISYDEAQKFYLTSSVKSPDGFEITSGGSRGRDFFPFFNVRSDYGSRYISGHNISKRIDISKEDYYGFTFLGWVIK